MSITDWFKYKKLKFFVRIHSWFFLMTFCHLINFRQSTRLNPAASWIGVRLEELVEKIVEELPPPTETASERISATSSDWPNLEKQWRNEMFKCASIYRRREHFWKTKNWETLFFSFLRSMQCKSHLWIECFLVIFLNQWGKCNLWWKIR